MTPKKIIIIFSILFLSFIKCYSQLDICDFSLTELHDYLGHFRPLDNSTWINGSIKSITMKQFEGQTLIKVVEVKSNQLGEINEAKFNVLKTVRKQYPLGIINFIHSTYDKFNNPIDVYFLEKNKEYKYLSYEYQYDSFGKIEKSIEIFHELQTINSSKPVFIFHNYFKNSNLIKRVGINKKNDTAIVINISYYVNNTIKCFEKNEGLPSSPKRSYLKLSFDNNGAITEQIDNSFGQFGHNFIIRYEKNGKVKEIEKHNNDGTVQLQKEDVDGIFQHYNAGIRKLPVTKIDSKGRIYMYDETHKICDGCIKKKHLFIFDKVGNTIEFQDMMSKDNYKEIFDIEYYESNSNLPKILKQYGGLGLLGLRDIYELEMKN